MLALNFLLASILLFFIYQNEALRIEFPRDGDIEDSTNGVYVRWTVDSVDDITHPIFISLLQATSDNFYLIESSGSANMTAGKWEFNVPASTTSTYRLHISGTEINESVEHFAISEDWKSENEPPSSFWASSSVSASTAHNAGSSSTSDTSSPMTLPLSTIAETADQEGLTVSSGFSIAISYLSAHAVTTLYPSPASQTTNLSSSPTSQPVVTHRLTVPVKIGVSVASVIIAAMLIASFVALWQSRRIPQRLVLSSSSQIVDPKEHWRKNTNASNREHQGEVAFELPTRFV